MIIDLDTAQNFKVDVTQEELNGLEEAIRAYTNNNFQVRNVRLEDVVFTSSSITSLRRRSIRLPNRHEVRYR